ncbi:hypothetical protein E3J48_05875, partial [Candidatus Aerophobetes bacterium]
MSKETKIKRQIEDLIKEYFSTRKSKSGFISGKTRIPLIVPSYDWEEVIEALDCLLSAQVTMGE